MNRRQQVRLSIKPDFDADVIIVGAGPAGASAAYHLGSLGHKVILLDKQKFPRDKVCGDFVGPTALLELRKLGITEWDEYKQSNIVQRASLYLDGKQLISELIPSIPGLPKFGRVIPRIQLDDWIMNAARKVGVKFLENHSVCAYKQLPDGICLEVKHQGKTLQLNSKVLIAADGSNSTITRQLREHTTSNTDRIVAVRAYYENVTCYPDEAELYFNASSFPGYYWLFPTGGGNANVGVGMVLETLPKTNKGLKQLLNQLIENDPVLSSRLKNSRMVTKIAGWPLNTYNHKLPITDDRLVLIGDAAGLINPLNGEGIQYAMLSGRWAAETVNDALRKNSLQRNALYAYEKKVQKELRYDMALASMIVQLIRNRTLNPVWLTALQIIATRARTDPDYAAITGGVLAGLIPASSVISQKVIGGTLQQAAISLGISTALKTMYSPRKTLKNGINTARASLDIAWYTIQHAPSTLGWSLGVTAGATELVGQIIADVYRKSGKQAQARALTGPFLSYKE